MRRLSPGYSVLVIVGDVGLLAGEAKSCTFGDGGEAIVAVVHYNSKEMGRMCGVVVEDAP
jgi:hypothetical protein